MLWDHRGHFAKNQWCGSASKKKIAASHIATSTMTTVQRMILPHINGLWREEALSLLFDGSRVVRFGADLFIRYGLVWLCPNVLAPLLLFFQGDFTAAAHS